MFKKMICAIGLAAGLTTTAQAQVLHYNGGINYNSETAFFRSGPDAAQPTFQVWCVDQGHLINGPPTGEDDLVTYTSLNGVSFANTRRAGDGNAAAQIKYTKAAYLATTMATAGHAADPGDGIKNTQFAMWAIIEGKTAGTECTAWGAINHTAECTLSTVQGDITAAGANYTTINKAEWIILTGRNGVDPYGYPNSNFNWQSSGMQELIARCVKSGRTQAQGYSVGGDVLPIGCDVPFNPPNDVPTPEPATMSLLALGLVGMAGAKFRRRK